MGNRKILTKQILIDIAQWNASKYLRPEKNSYTVWIRRFSGLRADQYFSLKQPMLLAINSTQSYWSTSSPAGNTNRPSILLVPPRPEQCLLLMWDRRAKRRVHLSPWRKRPRRHSRKATSLAQVETDRPEGLRMHQIYSVLLNSPALKWMSWPRRQSICQGRLKLTGTGFSFASFYISEVQPCHEASCTSDVIHIEGHCGRFLSRPCVFFFLARLKLSAVMIVLFELLGGKGWLGARGCPFFFYWL